MRSAVALFLAVATFVAPNLASKADPQKVIEAPSDVAAAPKHASRTASGTIARSNRVFEWRGRYHGVPFDIGSQPATSARRVCRAVFWAKER